MQEKRLRTSDLDFITKMSAIGLDDDRFYTVGYCGLWRSRLDTVFKHYWL